MQDDKHVLGVAAQTDTTKRCLLRHRVATHRRVTARTAPTVTDGSVISNGLAAHYITAET